MYAPNFDYYRARTLKEAHQLLGAHPGAKLLAGGHSLVPLMKLRLAAPSALVDIGRIPELRGISRDGAQIRIGALTTHAELAASQELRHAASALTDAAGMVGDPAVRNRGTIGGNIAHADPASDLPTALVALDARMVAAGPRGERTIPADQFFTGIMTTALGEDEILVAVLVPASGKGEASAYEKLSHPASRYAVVGVAAWIGVKDGTCSAARIAIGGLLPNARRAASVERALAGTSASGDAIDAAVRQASSDLGNDAAGDIYASAEYRAAMVPVLLKRAIDTAAARAKLI
ncbi:MAG TPA: xanthine dehydrogenase family protein subunit M [Vicinamibacterales bacterium]|jgi:carbon-monoxide dehydrogenase medium subunit